MQERLVHCVNTESITVNAINSSSWLKYSLKNSGLDEIQTRELCDTGAAL